MPAKKSVSDRIQNLRKRVAQSPTAPGIYRWLDGGNRVLYVGKAKNLRNRLRSYVNTDKAAGPWKQSFLEQIEDFDVTVTTTELEALLLETNLIKQLRPKYNVLMKDDKSYLFIRISTNEEYPRVDTVRRLEDDGAKRFGPYLSSELVRTTLDMLHAALQFRACKHSLEVLNKDANTGAVLKPCLEFQIGRCNGLCTGAVTKEEYNKRIGAVIAFLKGNVKPVEEALEKRMHEAATQKKFELAATMRNYLQHLRGEKEETQLATDTTGENSDILGIAVLSGRAHVVILHRRNGRLIGESHFALGGRADSVQSVLEQFLPQYYDEGKEIPETVIVPDEVEDRDVMEELLRERRGKAVKLLVPERGRKSHLLQLAEKNAEQKAKQLEIKWESEERNVQGAMKSLQELLSLPTLPKRIEGYDISHLGGTETVGSMVVTKGGKPANADYRSFTIRTMKRGEVDDYRALKEVLGRRLRRLTEDVRMEEKQWKADGIIFGKGRKNECEGIVKLIESSNGELCVDNIQSKECIVARQGKEIVGFVRLKKYPQGLLELHSVFVTDAFKGKRLGQFLARKVLRSVKKGKVYVVCTPALENYYGELGFRHIASVPQALEEKMTEAVKTHPTWKDDIVLMWEASQNKIDKSLTAKPDLLVIDGGKGQLSSVVEVLNELKLDIPVIGLAKREEEVFVPGSSNPIPFPPDSPAKFLLMRLRDEAHRFSNRHREKRIMKAATVSALDDVPGIGEETRTKLLKKFGSFAAVESASDAELLEVIGEAQLATLRAHLATETRHD